MTLTNEDLLVLSQLLDGKLKAVKDDVRDIHLTLENDLLPRLQNIESCYTSTYKRYQSGVNQIEAIQADIDVIKKIIIQHSEKIQQFA